MPLTLPAFENRDSGSLVSEIKNVPGPSVSGFRNTWGKLPQVSTATWHTRPTM
jgi:hypothetical protein